MSWLPRTKRRKRDCRLAVALVALFSVLSFSGLWVALWFAANCEPVLKEMMK